MHWVGVNKVFLLFYSSAVFITFDLFVVVSNTDSSALIYYIRDIANHQSYGGIFMYLLVRT